MKKKAEIKPIETKDEMKKVIGAIKMAAKELEKEPYDITKTDLMSNDYGVNEWDLRKLGGLAAVKKAHFPVPQKLLSEIAENKELGSYISKLEKDLGNKENLENLIVKLMKEKLAPLPAPKKLKLKSVKKASQKDRQVVAMINDSHYGLNVDPEEIDGLNSYSWTEACRRTALFVKEVSDYKLHKRSETKKLNLVINGDILAGIIHGLASKTLDLWIHQMNGAMHILTHVIHHLSQEFDEIEIHGLGGNHEEIPHKREGGHRVTQEHYDNFINATFYGLTVAFRNYKNIKFNLPKTPYIFFDLPSGRAMACHGHNMFSRQLGNPGKTINVENIGDAIREFNAGEELKGRKPVKLVLFGHTHSHAHFITKDGVEVYVAPSLSGLDAYAHQLNINTNFIGQVVFESTKDFILGDSLLVRLKKADNDSELDKIIPVYNRGLKWSEDKAKRS